MIHHIKEYGKTLAITGFRNASFDLAEQVLKDIRKKRLEIQFFDADLIANWQHLYFATLNAQRAHSTGANLSKSVAVETALYASAQRQIQRAIGQIGIKPETKRMAMVAVGESDAEVEGLVAKVSAELGVAPDESVLELTSQKTAKIKAAFHITNQELATAGGESALVDLVIEHMALLATQL
jgi:tRNA threonylcarbamoyladenosine modification (KEOPS) complex Cgi121 subunit